MSNLISLTPPPPSLHQVRNLCYMVSRREKLKLSQSKVQEQIFNLHVKLMNQEQAAGNAKKIHPVR